VARNFEIKGMKELERLIKQLGKLPQKCVTKAAKDGATIALQSARANAPMDSGELKNGIILRGERRVKVGKKMYDVMMDPAKNDIFVKVTADGTRYYYPASQEYGFVTADGGYVPGYHFLRNSITHNARVIEDTIVSVLSKEIDNELSKR
jgi:HK97 gp10 family phage protein